MDSEKKEVKGKFRYELDSKRFHRFKIETDAGVVKKLNDSFLIRKRIERLVYLWSKSFELIISIGT